VIIALGHPLDPQGPFEIHFSYHSIFEYSCPADLPFGVIGHYPP
jgi:hypothetical protein